MTFLALADDATGALETGARLSEVGLETRVRFQPGLAESGAALVVDTETRHLPAEEAGDRIRDIATRAKFARVSHVYKKTDSTLRGPIAAEFGALLEVWPERAIVYAPAYPELGRTVQNGQLLVDGRRLSATAFASDPRNPSGESSIAAVLGGSNVVTIGDPAELTEGLLSGYIYVVDGRTNYDLKRTAEAIRNRPCIVAGTAAMSTAWAGAIAAGVSRKWQRDRPVRTGLVVNGSLHPASHEQVSACGIPTAGLSSANQCSGWIQEGGWAALSAGLDREGNPALVAERLAQAVGRTVRECAPDCLIVCGGDTVFAVLRELGVDEVAPEGEVLPGTAVSAMPGGMRLVTKAGGFGGPDYLRHIRERLTGIGDLPTF